MSTANISRRRRKLAATNRRTDVVHQQDCSTTRRSDQVSKKLIYSYTNAEIYANMDLVNQIVQSIQKNPIDGGYKKTKDQLHFYKFRDLFKYEFVQSNILVLSKRSSGKLPQKHLYFAHSVFEIFSGMLTSFQLIQSSKSSR